MKKVHRPGLFENTLTIINQVEDSFALLSLSCSLFSPLIKNSLTLLCLSIILPSKEEQGASRGALTATALSLMAGWMDEGKEKEVKLERK